MDYGTRETIRKTSSGLGFMLSAMTVIMIILSYVFTYTFYNVLDSESSKMIGIIVYIAGIFITGLCYCGFSNTDMNSVIKVKRVKAGTLFPIILAGLAVTFIADYLTDILQCSFALFGIKNTADLSTQTSSVLDNILNFVSIAILPAIVEEFVFRGIILGKLRCFGDGFAIIFSSAMFALIHQNIVQIPFAFIIGITAALVTVKTESIIPAIFIHFFINFRSVIISILPDSADENLVNNIYILVIIAVLISGIISSLILSKDRNFFKVDYDRKIPFRTALGAAAGSGGVIAFLIISLFNTVLETGII